MGVKGRPACKTDNPPPSMSRLSRENLGASTSHNLMGLLGLLQEYFYLFIYNSAYKCVVVMKYVGTEWFL
jgi:hypothetical protein